MTLQGSLELKRQSLNEQLAAIEANIKIYNSQFNQLPAGDPRRDAIEEVRTEAILHGSALRQAKKAITDKLVDMRVEVGAVQVLHRIAVDSFQSEQGQKRKSDDPILVDGFKKPHKLIKKGNKNEY